EEVYGVDLIKEQLRIAAGEKLTLRQKDVKPIGHAVEVRICAEDPSQNFIPSPGEITLYYAPGGPGVRIDSHVYAGYTVPPYYDSMIAKLITRGADREDALNRMSRALRDYLIRGISTNVEFARAIVDDPVFRSGEATTRFVEEFLARTPKDVFARKRI
ncbi:MAG: acetyl-CoA carboxylase biotin carboxylase subunit, partial [Opitutales bacterium]